MNEYSFLVIEISKTIDFIYFIHEVYINDKMNTTNLSHDFYFILLSCYLFR